VCVCACVLFFYCTSQFEPYRYNHAILISRQQVWGFPESTCPLPVHVSCRRAKLAVPLAQG